MIKKLFLKHIHHRKFFVLLLFILIWLFLEPFGRKFILLSISLIYLYLLVSIMIIYVIRPNNTYFVITSSLIILSIATPTLNYSLHSVLLKNFDLLVNFAANFLITINVIWYTSSKRKYSNDDIFAAILAFLMIGACFADIYYNLYVFDPGVAHFMKSSVFLPDSSGHMPFVEGDFLYFSYTTLTTVGYGDIWPVSAIAKRLCSIEACTGVLYLAVFIGRLVMMYEAPEKHEKFLKHEAYEEKSKHKR